MDSDSGLIRALTGKGPLMVHSSYRALRAQFSTPEAFVEALLAAQGEQGVLFPTFSGSATDGPGCPPQFDVRNTPGYTGAIPEAARRLAGPSRRSLHPTHSVVGFGLGAESLLATHAFAATPCAPCSPIRQAARVALVGCGLESLTLFHAVEEHVSAAYVLQSEPTPIEVIDAHGNRVILGPMFLHSWNTPRDYPSMLPFLTERGLVESLEVEGVRMLLIDVERFWGPVCERVAARPSVLCAAP